MCATCGCGDEARVRVLGPDRLHQPSHDHDHEHDHDHDHEHGHEHEHEHEHGRTIVLQQKVLAKNDRLAEANRAWLAERGILAINLMSSPGAGKTTLLERTAREGRPRTGAVGHRRGSGDHPGRGPDRGGRLPGRADQHRGRLPPGRQHGGPRAARARPGAWLAAGHRERRQPGLPGPVRSGRGGPGGHLLGHRRRRQAGQVPADVPGRGSRPAQQGGPAALPGLRHRAARRRPGPGQPADPDPAGLGPHRRGPARLVRLAPPAPRRPRQPRP